jgi:hypothetical protein
MASSNFVHPISGNQLLFGRRKPLGGLRPHPLVGWSLFDMFKRALPTAPSSFDYTRPAGSPTLYVGMSDVLANDRTSDCTSCGAFKIVESWLGRSGTPGSFGVADALKFYGLSTGYDPANPATDQGGIETDVLGYWRDKGLDGQGAHAIAGYIPVHPADATNVKSLCWLFGNLYFGVDLPDAWTASPPNDGFVWTPGAPDPDQGHCFAGLGADDEGVTVVSWGLVGKITYPAIAQLCSPSAGGQLWCCLSKEDLAGAQRDIPGIDWATLVKDFDAEGGAVAA